MDFEQFAKKYKEIKSPKTDFESSNHKESEASGFIQFLRNEENRSKRKYYRMYILYSIGAIIYLFVFILNPDARLSIFNRISGACFVISFTILLLLFKKRHTEINKASYIETTKQFLTNAFYRYKFWNKQQLWLIPVLILIDLGASISFSKYLGNLNFAMGILLIQLAFWSLLIFGFIMGKKQWTRNKKPILHKIEKMLTDFEA